MNEYFKSVIVQATGASSISEQEIVQEQCIAGTHYF